MQPSASSTMVFIVTPKQVVRVPRLPFCSRQKTSLVRTEKYGLKLVTTGVCGKCRDASATDAEGMFNVRTFSALTDGTSVY